MRPWDWTNWVLPLRYADRVGVTIAEERKPCSLDRKPCGIGNIQAPPLRHDTRTSLAEFEKTSVCRADYAWSVSAEVAIRSRGVGDGNDSPFEVLTWPLDSGASSGSVAILLAGHRSPGV